jgi:hypothetical protein
MATNYIGDVPTSLKIGAGSAITGVTGMSELIGGEAEIESVWQDDLALPFDAGRHNVALHECVVKMADILNAKSNFVAGTKLSGNLIAIFTARGVPTSGTMATLTIVAPYVKSIGVAPNGKTQEASIVFSTYSTDGSTYPTTLAWS